MPKSAYYKILGLSSNASQDAVRKAYRKLAMKYHPDRNDSEKAEEYFIKITEAYEIVTGKKEPPTTKNTKNSPNTKKEKEDRVKKAQERFRQQARKEHQENERYYQSLISGKKWKIIKLSAWVGCILSFFILLDFFLPHHFTKDQVTHYKRNVSVQANVGGIGVIQTAKNKRYWVSNLNVDLYMNSHEIVVESSWIFHNPIKIHQWNKLNHNIYPIHFNFYSFIVPVFVLFLVPLGTVLYKRKKISFTFLHFFTYYVINGLILLYLLTNDRWAHVLTLGFI